MVSLVNSHTNATLNRWHLWEVDLRFALNSTPGWLTRQGAQGGSGGVSSSCKQGYQDMSYHVMLCHVVLCCGKSCHAMLCYVMLSNVMLYYGSPCTLTSTHHLSVQEVLGILARA